MGTYSALSTIILQQPEENIFVFISFTTNEGIYCSYYCAAQIKLILILNENNLVYFHEDEPFD